MEKHVLSKSSYLKGQQCTKALYFYKHFYHLKDPIPPERKALFDRGNKVGKLAQQCFPGGIDASPSKRFQFLESIEKTAALIEQGQEVIYEAAFQHDGVLVLLDVLAFEHGKWVAYEVKSSGKLNPVFLTDAALQYHIISRSGLELSDMRLMHLNTSYVRGEELDLQALFTSRSVLPEVLKMQEEIGQNIHRFKEVIAQPTLPEREIGSHCFDPYECDFKGQCWKKLPKNSVFELAGMRKDDQFALYREGHKILTELPENTTLSPQQQWQIEAAISGKPKVDLPQLKEFLGTLEYPLHFTDFEVFMPAVPLFPNTHPYQHLPFQFSIHRQEEPNGALEHREFLAEPGIDPHHSFLEAFLAHTEGSGSLVVFDQFLEKNTLKRLAKQFPAYKDALNQRLERMRDLQAPFMAGHYYHPGMKGHFSLKWVLPGLAPELAYSDLSINNGRLASHIFTKLQVETDLMNIMTWREDLLAYCSRDTQGLAHIMKALETAANL